MIGLEGNDLSCKSTVRSDIKLYIDNHDLPVCLD